jgi:methionyl-tRNA synthetase
MLKAIGIELPESVFAHGWWLVDGGKMSKSKGNVIDPLALLEEFGVDAFRYYLLAEMTAGQDASFSRARFIERYNSDLANNVGNLTNRILKLIVSTTGGTIPKQFYLEQQDLAFQQDILHTIPRVEQAVFDIKIHAGIEAIISAVKLCNQYLEKTEPWKLKRDASQRERLETILYTALEALRIISGLLFPIIPEKMTELRKTIGLEDEYILPHIENLKTWGKSVSGTHIETVKPLFPRI